MVRLTNTTGLVDDFTEEASLAARVNDVVLDAHEELLVAEMRADIDYRPVLSIFRRRGEYSFAVAYGCAIPSLKQFARHVRTSSVKLDKNETFCNAKRLDRIGRIACEQLEAKFPGIKFLGVREWRGEQCGTYYTYTVQY